MRPRHFDGPSWRLGGAGRRSRSPCGCSRIQPWPRRTKPMATRSTLRSATHTHDLPKDRFFNRELSRLDFDSRVLAMAEDVARPLAERIHFLAVVSSGL